MRAKSPSLRFLAALLLTWAAPLAVAQADAPEKVGVNAAVNTNAAGTPPGGITKKLVIGEDIVHNERVTTDAQGQTQILFVDGSSVSVGPNADMTIDDFVFDPKTGSGKMTLTDLQGAMRFVGGKLSKQEDAVTVHLGTSTIGVRGGIFLANTQRGGRSDVIFVFGKAVNVSGQSGCIQQLYRPGFAVSIDRPGGCPDSPHPAPLGAMSAILLNLDGRAGGNGGATTVPTNATVAASSVPNTVSNNVQLSVQQATANAGPVVVPPTPTVSPPQVQTQQTQTTANNPSPPSSTTPQPSPSTFPNMGNISGGLNVLEDSNPALGFPGQIRPYANATVQNGVLVITIGDQSGSIPLSPGTGTVNGNATYSPVGPLQGTTFATPDNTFFYANLAPINNPSNTVFVYGGTPVNQSAFQPTGSPQFLAFAVQQDPVLQSAIPFIRSVSGGALSNAVVSPLYLAVSPTTGFNVPPTGAAYPKALQASLAINGQGASQQSALVVGVGNAFAVTGNPGQTVAQPVLNGNIEGVYSPGSGATPTLINSGFLTGIDAAGNSFYGNKSISGFVLDSNECCFTNQIPASATETNPLTGQTTNYIFNQPVIATTLPSVGTGPQTTQVLTGYFGGIMSPYSNGTAGSPYAVLGATVIGTNASALQIAAVLAGADPFTPTQSGASALALSFGNLGLGNTGARQGYINDNLFAVQEALGATQQLNSNTTGSATLYLINQNAVAGAINSLLPAGVSTCACQYLQWGYWGGDLTTNSGGTTRNDIGAINTWVAGVPTLASQMPTVGTGSYSGAAIGSVSTGGATYVAAGGFSNMYNFGSNTGMVTISNFDNHTFTGNVAGSGSVYAGAIAGNGANGSLVGSFYGPHADETGGSFAVQGASGPSYIASGTFAGKLTGPIH